MLVSAAIMPHPPIIVPEVGGSQTKKVKKTISACQKIGQFFGKEDPDSIIVITPHGLVWPDRINICAMKNLFGSLEAFGAGEVHFSAQNDLSLVKKIIQKSEEEEISVLPYHSGTEFYELDHGVVVPLYFILPETGMVKIVPITYSLQDRETLFRFGQIVGEIIKSSKKRISIIASGDLSHRLTPFAPAGFSKEGKVFDQKIIKLLAQHQVEKILGLKESLVEKAGECGFRSILILLGALSLFKVKPKVLSYEGPFGVGYGVIQYKIEGVLD